MACAPARPAMPTGAPPPSTTRAGQLGHSGHDNDTRGADSQIPQLWSASGPKRARKASTINTRGAQSVRGEPPEGRHDTRGAPPAT